MRLFCVVSLVVVATFPASAFASDVENNIQHSLNLPTGRPLDADCAAWNAPAVKIDDGSLSVDVKRLALQLGAIAAASKSGANPRAANSLHCERAHPLLDQ
jgi:hypothetical protein